MGVPAARMPRAGRRSALALLALLPLAWATCEDQACGAAEAEAEALTAPALLQSRFSNQAQKTVVREAGEAGATQPWRRRGGHWRRKRSGWDWGEDDEPEEPHEDDVAGSEEPEEPHEPEGPEGFEEPDEDDVAGEGFEEPHEDDVAGSEEPEEPLGSEEETTVGPSSTRLPDTTTPSPPEEEEETTVGPSSTRLPDTTTPSPPEEEETTVGPSSTRPPATTTTRPSEVETTTPRTQERAAARRARMALRRRARKSNSGASPRVGPRPPNARGRTPRIVQEPRPPPGEDSDTETVYQKEWIGAEIVQALGPSGDLRSEAAHVLEELAAGQKPSAQEIGDMEGVLAASQTPETALKNRALLTTHDLEQLTGKSAEDDMTDAEHLKLLDVQKPDDSFWDKGNHSKGTPWTGGKIPYCFSPDLDLKIRDLFKQAVSLIEERVTCLRFREVLHKAGDSRTPEYFERGFDPKKQTECEVSPAIFVKSSPVLGCHAFYGMPTKKIHGKANNVQLHPSHCSFIGLVVHELGHALGMNHENQRVDRDQYIRVIEDNIQPAHLRSFLKDPDMDSKSPYDILSNLHYDPYSSFKSGSGPVLTKKDGSVSGIGNALFFSQGDLKQLALMYGPEVGGTCSIPQGQEGCVDIKDADVTCSREMKGGAGTCDEDQQLVCCGCGGGLLINCFGGYTKDCLARVPFAGPNVPYEAALEVGGEIGDYVGTVDEIYAKCKETDGCKGIQTRDGCDKRTGQKSFRMMKHFKTLPGFKSSNGKPWCAYQIQTTMTQTTGWLEAGGNIDFEDGSDDNWQRTTVEEAKAKCQRRSDCQGITFPGPVTDGEQWILFKHHKRPGGELINGKPWNSFIKD